MRSAIAGGRRGRPLDIILGVDFGTTSTKIVARIPFFVSGSPTYAVPVPAFARAEEHAYLWASRLWLGTDGTFSLMPLPGAQLVCAIKTNLMEPRTDAQPLLAVDAGLSATPEEVATAFLALQVRQAKGWLLSEKASLLGREEIRWSYNLGFPAASLDNSELRTRYERCAAAAVELAATATAITLAVVRGALAGAAADTKAWLERHAIELHPEIAAAIAGFADSSQSEDGLYAMVDVGGSTVDCSTFNLFRDRDGTRKCSILAARVELLGVEPWRLCADDRTSSDEFRYLLDTLQWGVIWRTRMVRDHESSRWKEGLPLFFLGGGALSEPHRASTTELDAWLRRHTSTTAGVQIKALPAPENLDHPECGGDEVSRLGVAIGLSLPRDVIPEVDLPLSIEDVAPAPHSQIDDRYIDKSQT